VTGAKAGTLSFLVGGSKQSFSRASPILALMGQRIIHCGSAGSGLAAKICNNLILGVEQIVVAEAMLLGQRLGLDPAVLANVINNSTGGCWSSTVNNPVPGALPEKSPPCERGFEGGFATALMIKVGDVKWSLNGPSTQLERFCCAWGGTGSGIGNGCLKSIGFTTAVGRSSRKDIRGGCEAVP
jgi:3-hydroxyisobutyrate dehydrogenase-like beta-hydroxyacid dehydrogenase